MDAHFATPPPLNEEAMFALADDNLFGKCDDDLEFRLPTAMKEELGKWAAERRMSKGAAARLFIATGLRGADHVVSVAVERVTVARSDARTDAPSTDRA
jgi:hypothetical protein